MEIGFREGITEDDFASLIKPKAGVECAPAVFIEKRSEWEGYRDGAQAGFGERLKRRFSYWEILGVGR